VLRELEVMIDFVILEGIKVKDDPLKVNDKYIWSLGNQGSLADIHLLLAASALIIADDLTLDLSLEAFVHSFDIFHGKWKVVEILKSILELAALRANKLIALLSSKDWLQKSLTWGALESSLKPFEEEVEELLSIFLLCSVGWTTIKLLEGKAELPWVIVLSFREFQVSHQLLQLMQHVIIDWVTFVFLDIIWLAIIDTEKIVSESWDCEELLEHWVHVANATKVTKTDKLLAPTWSRWWSVVPGLCSLNMGH
jgi:hypothetical protein